MKFFAIIQLIVLIFLLQGRLEARDDDNHDGHEHRHHHDHDHDHDHDGDRDGSDDDHPDDDMKAPSCSCKRHDDDDDDYEGDRAGCYYSGSGSLHGDHFLAADGCNNCTCCNGRVECTTRACSTLGCTSWDGTLIPPKNSYLDETHSCVSCDCAINGDTALGLMCPMPNCAWPRCKFWEKVDFSHKKGCCPGCKFNVKRVAYVGGGSFLGLVLIVIVAVLIAKRKKLRCCAKTSLYIPMGDVPFEKVKVADNSLPEKKPLE